jgi:DNA ligase-1
MSSAETQMLLEIIANTPSTEEKRALAREFLEVQFFKDVVRYAYSPFLSYHLRGITVTGKGANEFGQEAFALLDRLSRRTLSGNDARETVAGFLGTLEPLSRELFTRILNKDLRTGLSVKGWNAACPGLIPEFGYMRCSLPNAVDLSRWNWKEGVFSQEKADGIFVNVTCKDGTVSVNTRKGHPLGIQHFPKLEKEFRLFSGQFHGELLVKISGTIADRKTGNGLINSVMKGGSFQETVEPVFVFWDYVTDRRLPYRDRFKGLVEKCFYLSATIVNTKIVYSQEEAREHFEEILSRGGEGTVLKTKYGMWKDGVSKEQVKLKAERDCELMILDFVEGLGKYQDTLGAITCGSRDGVLRVNVSGFTDREREDIWNARDDLRGAIVTVRYNEKIRNKEGKWSLFLPRFIEIRHDKTTADSFYEI